MIHRESNPVLIASPIELAGMTLESRLVSYDWENQFESFQKVTRTGSFRPICLDARNNELAVSWSFFSIVHALHFIIIDMNIPNLYKWVCTFCEFLLNFIRLKPCPNPSETESYSELNWTEFTPLAYLNISKINPMYRLWLAQRLCALCDKEHLSLRQFL